MFKGIFNKIKQLGVKGIIQMHLGYLCCAISSVIFLSPAHMITGGATGLSIWLSEILSLNYYIFLYIINGVLLILSGLFLGKEYTIKTIYGSIMLPTFGMLLTFICNITKFDINTVIALCDPTFVVIFAAALMGFGIGVNMKLGGSTGGFDILESLGLKYLHIPYSTSMYILDAVLIIGGMITYSPSDYGENILFANALSEGLGAILYVFLVGYIIDLITFGGYNKRAVFIRSTKYEQIHDAIINELIRGLTYVNAEGGYSKESTKMILCICYSREYFMLRDMVNKIDPYAFIFVTKATEVRGLGFSIETPEHLARHKNKKQTKENDSKTAN